MIKPDTDSSSAIAFSICIPCYNGRKFLRETLESVRAQTHLNWELIVVEDASPEPSRDIVKAFDASVSQRVIYHVNPTNLKTPHTRDQAHKLATYDYIAPLDYDDLWKPNHLAEFAEFFANNDADFIFTGCFCFSGSIENITRTNMPSKDMMDQLNLNYRLLCFFTQPSSIAITRRLLNRVGPWSKNIEFRRHHLPGIPEMGEDRNFFLNAMQMGTKLHWTGSITTYYRQSEGSIQSSRQSHARVNRGWANNYYGIIPGSPVWPQRSYISQSCANAARDLRSEPKHVRLSALFYFRSWRWNPLKLHRLLQAGLALCFATRPHSRSQEN